MSRILVVILLTVSLIEGQSHDSQLFKQLPARVITKESFNFVLNEPLQGTFILFQAPWCGR